MKNKILVIILCIVFIGILFGTQQFLNQQAKPDSVIKEENMKVLEVMSNQFEEEVLKSEKTVLVDFYADWCGPCKMLSPIIDEIASENSDIKVCRINIDANQDLAIQYEVMSIPTLVVIKNGTEVNRAVGVLPKNEIVDMLK